jgi:tetratricopeptide (TPR) repeat protein
MKRIEPIGEPAKGSGSRAVVLAFVAVVLFVVALGLILNRHPVQRSYDAPRNGISPDSPEPSSYSRGSSRGPSPRRRTVESLPANSQPAEEIVASKVSQFGKRRCELMRAMAKHYHVEVPSEVERFFAAVESGRWEEIDAAHKALLAPGENLNQPGSPDLHQIWRPIQETWGAAREAHSWPAQILLDYGNAVLNSLRPGMIYAGGTDPGCFIPTMLNETADGERHIVLTQNALADGTYLNYLNFQYADQMSTLTDEESQRAFQDYVADAQKRLQHDQQFPDEPKQIKPGEDVKMVDGKTQVSGQVAVMSINEKLFQMLMDKNPSVPFAMEESFPFASMYKNATTLGPILEMRADGQNSLTSERAAQSVDYWREAAQQLLSDPEITADSDPRKAYSKLVSSQAGLLQGQNFTAEAEQAFRIALDLCPTSPEAVFRYANLLMKQNRAADALPVVEAAAQAAPENQQFQGLLQQLQKQKTKSP